MSNGPLLTYATTDAGGAPVSASYGFFEGWAATGPTGSYFLVDHTTSELSDIRAAGNRDFVSNTTWTGFSGGLPTRLLTIWLGEDDANRTFVLHTPEGSVAWLTAAWVDDTAGSGVAGYQVSATIGINQAFWLVREIDGTTQYGEMGIENLTLDWSNAFPPVEPPPPPEDPPYEPDMQTVTVQVGENHWNDTIRIHMGDGSIVYPTADWGNQGSQTATDSNGNVYYSYNWVMFVASVDMNLGIASIDDAQGHTDLMDGFNPPPPPEDPPQERQTQQVTVQVGENHWGHEIRVRLEDNTLVVAAPDESSVASQDAVDVYGNVYYQYWWKNYVATIPAGAGYSVEDDQGHTGFMDGFEPPYQPFYQTLTIQVGENHWNHPVLITLGDGSIVYPVADWENIGTQNAVANNGVVFYTYQYVNYTATIDVNLGYSIADGDGHTALMDGFNPPPPPADPQVRLFNISEEHWGHQPRITQADGTVIVLEPDWSTITSYNGTDSNGVVYFSDRYATFSGTIDVNQAHSISDTAGHQQLFNPVPPPGTYPEPLYLKIAASRWNHALEVRTSSGQTFALSADQMQGFWTVDQTSQSWWNSYYFFNATSSYIPAENWWVHDVTTGDTAPVNTHDLANWASPDATLDTDQDGLVDWYEQLIGTGLINPDSDGDEMIDGWEIAHGFNPKNIDDGQVDTDGDGATNPQEFLADSDPRDADTDGDGWSDGAELGMGTDPRIADTDEDGDRIPTVLELLNGTDPNDYYNGVLPTLTVLAGTGVAGKPGESLPTAIEILVSNGQLTLVNAPVMLNIPIGDATLAPASNSQTSWQTLEVRTDADGIASADLRMGMESNDIVLVRAEAVAGQEIVEDSWLIPVDTWKSAFRLIAGSAPVSGGQYVLAAKEDKTVWGLGVNWSGQLGNGTTAATRFPTQVLRSPGAPLTEVMSLSAKNEHALALDESLGVWSWGANDFGQLGDGTSNGSVFAKRVMKDATAPLDKIVAVSAGAYHTLALQEDGTVWAWGLNLYGELGNADVPNGRWHTAAEARSVYPVKVNGIDDVIAVSAGDFCSLALRRDGTVWAWGWRGEAGGGDAFGWWQQNWGWILSVSSHVPMQVMGLEEAGTTITAISMGDYCAMARRSDGTVWGWGSNWSGQLGDGTASFRTTPVQVQGLDDVLIKSVSAAGSLALDADGGVWTWAGFHAPRRMAGPLPTVQVPGLTASAVSGSWSFALALSEEGTIQGWGANWSGQLGDQLSHSSDVPIPIIGADRVIAVAAGEEHSLALKQNGTVLAWGSTTPGSSGTVDPTPTPVANLTNVTHVAAGDFHSLALKADGTVFAWGSNLHGQLGDNTHQPRPTPAPAQNLADRFVAAIAAGAQHSLALENNGTVWAWGSNQRKQLGNNSPASSPLPSPVQNLTNVLGIAAGGSFSVALKNDHTVWIWGKMSDTPLGDLGLTQESAIPVQVAISGDVTAIAAGASHALLLKSDHTVWAWGGGGGGQLGMNDWANYSTPVQISGLTDIIAVAAHGGISMAVKADGTVWAWGQGGFADPNRPTAPDLLIIGPAPTQISLEGVVAAAPGGVHCLALKEDGTLASWGYSPFGQLGVGLTDNQPTPTAMLQINLRRSAPPAVVAGDSVVPLGQVANFSVLGADFDAPGKVDFYNGDQWIGDTNSQLSFKPKSWGNYRITAVGVDANGARSPRSSTFILHVPFDSQGDGIPDWVKARDSDEDGIPDWWEVNWNLDPFDSGDALSRIDGRGRTALQHFLEGAELTTDGPPNRERWSRKPRVKLELTTNAGGARVLRWTGDISQGGNVQLQRQNANGTWSTIATVPASDMSYELSAANGQPWSEPSSEENYRADGDFTSNETLRIIRLMSRTAAQIFFCK